VNEQLNHEACEENGRHFDEFRAIPCDCFVLSKHAGVFVGCAELERWPLRGELVVKYRCHAFGGAVGAQTMRNRHKALCNSEINSRFVEANSDASYHLTQ
jgi:hypothetical protein